MEDHKTFSEILKKLIEIEERINILEGKTTITNSSNGRAVFHSLISERESHSHDAKSLDRILENSADLIIEHYRRQPPKRQ